MRLGTLKNGRAVIIQGDDQVVELATVGWSGSLLEFIQSEKKLNSLTLEDAAWKELNRKDLATPLARPSKIICIGLNYRKHAIESQMAIPTQPIIFTRFDTTLNAPFGDIPLDSSLTDQLDYEVELAVVIGRGGKHIPRQEALEYVFGYTACNDISARDLQLGSDTGGQWTRGKNVDLTCPLGPWIVTSDEIPDPQTLRLTCEVNGAILQDSNTADMIFSVQEIVHRLSHWFSLEAGDVIITGTPEGVGFTRTPPIFLHPGDVVRASVQGIGTLENRIVEVV